jgi:hypothetical protein
MPSYRFVCSPLGTNQTSPHLERTRAWRWIQIKPRLPWKPLWGVPYPREFRANQGFERSRKNHGDNHGSTESRNLLLPCLRSWWTGQAGGPNRLGVTRAQDETGLWRGDHGVCGGAPRPHCWEGVG